ncbi:hypothetical protein FHS96_000270 [Sphingomonas zeicaulis]|uniref:DUF1905 domain-containing protein n=1 Tax=Sphingomonas zeicaulis TaxID=1632740 RepID=UPI003D227DDA
MLDEDFLFEGPVIHWRGPAPFFFVAVPAELVEAIRHAARSLSYGWGVVPVMARIGDAPLFGTSLFPRDGGYLLPLKDVVRRQAGVEPGDLVAISMQLGKLKR